MKLGLWDLYSTLFCSLHASYQRSLSIFLSDAGHTVHKLLQLYLQHLQLHQPKRYLAASNFNGNNILISPLMTTSKVGFKFSTAIAITCSCITFMCV